MRPRAALALLAALTAVWLLWPPSPPTTAGQPPSPGRTAASSPPAATTTLLTAPAPEAAPSNPHEAPPVEGTVAAHQAIAEAVGDTAIRCFVGEAWDTQDIVGPYHGKIEGGWYSDVVPTPTGERVVERQYLLPRSPRSTRHHRAVEVLFTVGWDASTPDGATRCTVNEPPRGDLRVQLVDAEGQPRDGFVWGCGTVERVTDGAVTLEQVVANTRCTLNAMGEPDWTSARAAIEPLAPDEVRDVRIELGQSELPDGWSDDSLHDSFEDYSSYKPQVSERTARLAALEAQLARAPADSRESEVLQQVVRHHAWLLERDLARVAIDEDTPPPNPTNEQLEAWFDASGKQIDAFVRDYWSGQAFTYEGGGAEAVP